MKQLNFDGKEVNDKLKPSGNKSPYQWFKIANGYHKSKGKKCCEVCKYFREVYHQKVFFKCELLGISMSRATDIRRSYVCLKYEQRQAG